MTAVGQGVALGHPEGCSWDRRPAFSRITQSAAARAMNESAAVNTGSRLRAEPEGRVTLELSLRQSLEEFDVVLAPRNLLDDRFGGRR